MNTARLELFQVLNALLDIFPLRNTHSNIFVSEIVVFLSELKILVLHLLGSRCLELLHLWFTGIDDRGEGLSFDNLEITFFDLQRRESSYSFGIRRKSELWQRTGCSHKFQVSFAVLVSELSEDGLLYIYCRFVGAFLLYGCKLRVQLLSSTYQVIYKVLVFS